MMPITRILLAATVAAAVVGCSGREEPVAPAEGPEPTTEAEATEAAPAAPTVVERDDPVPTATPEAPTDPLSPVGSKPLPGVVVPAGATLVRFSPATADTDARADYAMEDADAEALAAWFLEELPQAGWGTGRDSDGALIFLHRDELSARHADEGLKRTLTVFLDSVDDADFSLVVEAAAE
jgi:hypothetical protein